MQMDNAFTGWSGQACIIQPDLGYQLQCQTEDTPIYLLLCPAAVLSSASSRSMFTICRGGQASNCCNPVQLVNCNIRCSTRHWIIEGAGQPIAFSDNGTHCSEQLHIARYSFTSNQTGKSHCNALMGRDDPAETARNRGWPQQ